MRKRVALYIYNEKLLRKEQPVLVALSGGADSVALLCILQDLGYSLHALHCNFHLRGDESNRDEEFVKRLCEKRSIALTIRHFQTLKYAQEHHTSVEMAARDLRYEWFRDEIKKQGAQGIAVAHHRDDQAETLLLNLLRGTGLRGLAGMQNSREGIIRPLLCVSRQDILQYLSSIHQDYVTDSTNLERDAVRNRIRLDVLPLLSTINPQISEALSALCTILQGSLPYYQEGVQICMKKNGITPSEFDLKWLADTPKENVLLHEWLRPMHFNAAQQAEMMAARDNTCGRIWESDTHRVLLDRTALVAERKGIKTEKPVIQEEIVDHMEPANQFTAFFDADRLVLPLSTRPVKQGDKMVPLGMKGYKLVSNLMTDCKLNRFQKERQWVVTSGEDIIWVIGLRSDNRFRVTDHTSRILRLKVVTQAE